MSITHNCDYLPRNYKKILKEKMVFSFSTDSKIQIRFGNVQQKNT
mgnify:CR=1 FL=1